MMVEEVGMICVQFLVILFCFDRIWKIYGGEQIKYIGISKVMAIYFVTYMRERSVGVKFYRGDEGSFGIKKKTFGWEI